MEQFVLQASIKPPFKLIEEQFHMRFLNDIFTALRCQHVIFYCYTTKLRS